MYRNGYRLLLLLLGFFCIAYPIAVIGVTFDVQPTFSLSWAASALLLLEGTLLILAATLIYDWWRGLWAALVVVTLSALIEDVGVSTGFPFGVYHYTAILQPGITAHVPLPVPFAWALVIFGSYGLLHGTPGLRRHIGFTGTVLGAGLATLLDLAIEPVATYVEHYWIWQPTSTITYYGVPLTNFIAWFSVAFVLLLLVDWIFIHPLSSIARPDSNLAGGLAWNIPVWLFTGSLFMFGLIDLSHGYYAGSAFALLAGCITYWLRRKR